MKQLYKLINSTFFLFIAISSAAQQGPVANAAIKLSGELKKWHKVTLTFEGPETSELDKINPFLAYRLEVTFTHQKTNKSYTIPGYYAADGNAGETSADKGNKWKVHFAPDEIGTWKYTVAFRKGHYAALTEVTKISKSAGFMDGAQGTFEIAPSDKKGRDFKAKGRLQYVGERYLKFAETGEYFLKVGPDAPENFLSYIDFDGTFHNDGHKDHLVKTWEAHLKHWKTGNPSWKDGKGKALIGAVNYLAAKGLNVFSFLTFNIGGDDQNVFPFVDYDTWDRYDVSKLDQWEKVFEYADQLGLFLHFKLSETENQGLLDNGAIGMNTQLYYRELIARFGHHLALNWNIGEENGAWEGKHKTMPLNTAQRLAAAKALQDIDPYDHHIVIHNGLYFDDVLGTESAITGPSIQTHHEDFGTVHSEVLKWLEKSKKAGKQWAASVDEPGDAMHALLPDVEDPTHDIARQNGLWGAFMAGAWGTEWYFGYKHPHSDLSCQDYASRDLFWDQCKYVLDFFKGNNIPFWETENMDTLVSDGNYCLAKNDDFYIVYLKKGTGTINLEKITGDYSVQWYDPRKGGALQTGKTKTIVGGTNITLKNAPSEKTQDWVVLLRKK